MRSPSLSRPPSGTAFFDIQWKCVIFENMFRLSRIALLSLFASILLAACDTEQRQRVESTLNDVESYINERPDSALAVLQGMGSTGTMQIVLACTTILLTSRKILVILAKQP